MDQYQENQLTPGQSLPAPVCSPVERLAQCVGMPVEQVRGALENIAKTNRINRLKAKLLLIKERRAAITPKGEIVEIGTPGSMAYQYPENARNLAPPP